MSTCCATSTVWWWWCFFYIDGGYFYDCSVVCRSPSRKLMRQKFFKKKLQTQVKMIAERQRANMQGLQEQKEEPAKIQNAVSAV